MKSWGFYRKLQSVLVLLEQVCFELSAFVLSQVFGMELEQVDCEEAVDCVVWVTTCGYWSVYRTDLMLPSTWIPVLPGIWQV